MIEVNLSCDLDLDSDFFFFPFERIRLGIRDNGFFLTLTAATVPHI